MQRGFLIDQLNIYERLGHDKIVALATAFYTRVYADDDPELSAMFQPIPKASAIQNQYEFLIQRFGGPPLYSTRKGHPALRARHARFAVTTSAAHRWLSHMYAAMDEVGIERGGDNRAALDEFFYDVAMFLRNQPDPEPTPAS